RRLASKLGRSDEACRAVHASERRLECRSPAAASLFHYSFLRVRCKSPHIRTMPFASLPTKRRLQDRTVGSDDAGLATDIPANRAATPRSLEAESSEPAFDVEDLHR